MTSYFVDKIIVYLTGSGADPGFFLGGGALVSCSTSTPINHIVFFFCRIPVVLENCRSSQGRVRTPCTLPLDLPLWFTHLSECVLYKTIALARLSLFVFPLACLPWALACKMLACVTRLQNSLYFCIFKYARAVKQRSGPKLKTKRETACEAHAFHACETLKVHLTDFEKKDQLSCSLLCDNPLGFALLSRTVILKALLQSSK